jgi:ABC-type transport system involved in multi-copper enzyme maturation permease subunit
MGKQITLDTIAVMLITTVFLAITWGPLLLAGTYTREDIPSLILLFNIMMLCIIGPVILPSLAMQLPGLRNLDPDRHLHDFASLSMELDFESSVSRNQEEITLQRDKLPLN